MPIDIKMPQLGESVVEGTISRWLKKPGERVEKYEALLEVMTDKVDTEVPAPEAGVLREILVPEGETVKVGTLIAMLDSQELAASAPLPVAAALSTPVQAEQVSTNVASSFVSPVVARLAAERGLDLSRITGSGTGGRVTKKDVLQYEVQGLGVKGQELETRDQETDSAAPMPYALNPEPSAAQAPGPRPQAPIPTPLPDDAELIPLSPMRRAIAERMVDSVRTAPHVTTVFEVDMGAVALHRMKNKADFERQGVNLTFTAYLAQAVCVGLRAVSLLNASFGEQGIIRHNRIHLGVAVALDEGLIVPVIRDADEKNLLGLARAVNDLAARARNRRLRGEETQGGTFTVTNHGVSGSLFATPIINQPQGGILGVGAIQKRPVVITQNGVDAIAIRPMCYLSLTFDHRLMDGAMADGFLAAVKRALEGIN